MRTSNGSNCGWQFQTRGLRIPRPTQGSTSFRRITTIVLPISTARCGIIRKCSMVIAQNLAAGGDTMKMLQAVLDTNFWLATHVVIVTLGYAATFLAGLLGIFYVLKGVMGSSMTRDDSKDIGRMIYGIVCFAILFSFVGTILGGIWADQSWGRFWGWDPKENGAVLIVLWNALVLHARWAGLVRERGLAALAIDRKSVV